MESHEEILALLRRIEANQTAALEAQKEHLALAKAQLERTERTIGESIALQKEAVRRQAFVAKLGLPIVLVLLVLLAYLLVRWRIL